MHFLLLQLSAASVVGHACEHNISSVFLRVLVLYGIDWSGRRLLVLRRRRAGRRRRHYPFALGDAGEPVAFPCCMVGRLRAAVELAGGIECLFVGERRLPGRPATLLLGSGPLFGLLIFNCGHLPTGGSRHGGLALVIILVGTPIGVASRRLRSRSNHLPRGVYSKLGLHRGVGRGVLVRDDQEFVEGSRLVAEESVLEEGALSAPGGEVLDGLNLVHPLAGVAELGPPREVVTGRVIGPLDAEGELARLGGRL